MTDMPIIPELADPDGDLVAEVLSRLLQEPDAAARLRACAALDGTPAGLSGRLGWIRQVSVAELHAEGNSYEAIGRTMGVTKARAYQIHKSAMDPAYAWGRALTALRALAAAVDRVRPGGGYEWGEAYKLITTGLATTVIRPRIEDTARRYARIARVRGGVDVAARVGRLAELLEASAELPTGHLTMEQRAQVVLGLHHEAVERRALRAADSPAV